MNPNDKGTIRDAMISRAVGAFLTSQTRVQPALETDDRTQQTRLRTDRDPFAYLMTLEHH